MTPRALTPRARGCRRAPEFAVKACHGRAPDPRCRARNNRQVRTGFGEWPVFPYKNPRAAPGSAGFQPAAGRRPAAVHAGKMPALPGEATSRGTTFILRGGRPAMGVCETACFRSREVPGIEGILPSQSRAGRPRSRGHHKWDVHPRHRVAAPPHEDEAKRHDPVNEARGEVVSLFGHRHAPPGGLRAPILGCPAPGGTGSYPAGRRRTRRSGVYDIGDPVRFSERCPRMSRAPQDGARRRPTAVGRHPGCGPPRVGGAREGGGTRLVVVPPAAAVEDKPGGARLAPSHGKATGIADNGRCRHWRR